MEKSRNHLLSQTIAVFIIYNGKKPQSSAHADDRGLYCFIVIIPSPP
jgi:hypothetical protein